MEENRVYTQERVYVYQRAYSAIMFDISEKGDLLQLAILFILLRSLVISLFDERTLWLAITDLDSPYTLEEQSRLGEIRRYFVDMQACVTQCYMNMARIFADVGLYTEIDAAERHLTYSMTEPSRVQYLETKKLATNMLMAEEA
jgi:hypothetical protein